MNEKFDRDAPLPGHYLHRAPSGIVGVVAVLIALLMLGFAISEVRRIGHAQPGLAFNNTAGSVSENTYILQVSESEWRLNGQPVEENDRVFRLAGAAARSPAIVVEYPPTLPASTLESALELVSRSGFTQVGMRTMDKQPANSAATPNLTAEVEHTTDAQVLRASELE